MPMSDNIEVIALEKMVNGSEAMFERRRRILRESRKLIQTAGLEQLNMRELSLRACRQRRFTTRLAVKRR